MSQTPPSSSDQVEPPRLKFLRWLVIGLTATMIVGLITIVSLIVMTFMRSNDRTGAHDFTIPAQIKLPPGEFLQAYTRGKGWDAIVTVGDDSVDRIHILDPESGDIRQTIDIYVGP